MRTLRIAFAATLFTAGCSNDRVTTVEMTARITEGQVATSVAALAIGTIALEEDSPSLLEQVRVTDANARVIALQAVAGDRIVEAELEKERDRLLYSYEVQRGDGRGVVQVEIDATTGTVVRETHERNYGADADRSEPKREDDTRGR